MHYDLTDKSPDWLSSLAANSIRRGFNFDEASEASWKMREKTEKSDAFNWSSGANIDYSNNFPFIYGAIFMKNPSLSWRQASHNFQFPAILVATWRLRNLS